MTRQVRTPRKLAVAVLTAGVAGAMTATLALTGPASAAPTADPTPPPATTTPPPATTPPPPAPVPDLRVMQLNIRQSMSPTNWAANAERAIAVSDIADFNEAERPANRLAMANMLERHGWDYWLPATTGLENPITWNASMFTFVSGSSVEVQKPIRRLTPERAINTVVLRDLRNGQLIAMVATHTINKGAPDGGKKISKRRTPILKKHIKMLKTAILNAAKITPYVVATGDWNVNHLRDRFIQAPGLPTAVLGPIVNFDMPMKQTWRAGKSLLDYIVTPKTDTALVPVTSSIFKNTTSDHFGVTVGFTYPEGVPPVTAQPTSGARFMPSTVRNNPRGKTTARRAAINAVRRAIANAGRGGAIHVATARVNDRGTYRALTKAHNRGVRVQVVVRHTGKLTNREQALSNLLGRRTSSGEWFTRCTSRTCHAVSKKMAASTILVSRSGVTSAVRLTLTRALDATATKKRTTARQTTSLTSYNKSFHSYFLLIA